MITAKYELYMVFGYISNPNHLTYTKIKRNRPKSNSMYNNIKPEYRVSTILIAVY